jgi:hypothetical protein
MLFLQLLWVLTFSTAKFAEFFLFFFGQGCILQRGHDHTNVPMPVKGYDGGSTSCFNNNNNAGLQYVIVKGKWSVTAEFVVLFRDCIFQQQCEDDCAYARCRALLLFNACCCNHNTNLLSSIIL